MELARMNPHQRSNSLQSTLYLILSSSSERISSERYVPCPSVRFVGLMTQGERNYIMQVVCEATQNGAVNVQVGAFECLVRIMSLYYEKMGLYMEQALFGVSFFLLFISKLAELKLFVVDCCRYETSRRACGFAGRRILVHCLRRGGRTSYRSPGGTSPNFGLWTTTKGDYQAQEYGDAPETESKFFAKIALPEIVPVLLQLLCQQEEDADDDEWNVSMAAGTCLSLLAGAVQDAIVPAVIPFIEAHIKAEDWHRREAAIMTFGSILEGPDPTVLTPLVNQALPLLIDMMTDQNVHVKDTTAWTLGRICDLLITCIKPDAHLHPLISALVNGLQDSPRIVANCCWALMNLADQYVYFEEEGEATQAGPLSPYYEGVVQALMRVTDRYVLENSRYQNAHSKVLNSTGNEANFRTAAYEAITSYLTHATPDAIGVVQSTAVTVLQRMEHLLSIQNQILGVDDRNNWNELQSNLCAVVIVSYTLVACQ